MSPVLLVAFLTALLAPRAATPIGEAELAAVLRDGHTAVFGAPPSDTRLAVAWGHVALENGRGP